MATTKGSSGVIKVQVKDTTVAVLGEVRSYTLTQTADTIEDTTMGDTDRTYLSSLKSSTLSCEVYWDDADAQQLIMDAGASIDFEIYPTGTGTATATSYRDKKKYRDNGALRHEAKVVNRSQ